MPESVSSNRHSRVLGLLLLLAPILFNLVWLAPELRIGTHPLNDHVFHLRATERAAAALTAGENPLDVWVGDFSLGYPVWRSYPPLPHLFTGALAALASPLADATAVFLFCHYLLLSLLPAAFFLLAWEFRLGWIASGATAALSITVSGADQFGRFGLGYGAQIWRGSGLYSQLWATALALAGIALFLRLLRTGRGRVLPGVILAAACLSHFVVGLFAVFTAVLLSAFQRTAVSGLGRLFRLASTMSIVALASAFFVLPLFQSRQSINHSRWEDQWKWDSFGAAAILRALTDGTLLDFGRLPVVTLLAVAGLGLSLWAFRRRQPQRELAVLALFWLAVFFGRHTWGHLLTLLAIPEDMHLHRFQLAFEVCAVLLAALAFAALLNKFQPDASAARAAVSLIAAALLLAPSYYERYQFLQLNTQWGDENRAAHQAAAVHLQPLLSALRQVHAANPGRVHAGKAATWGATFRIGSVPVYAEIARAGLPGTSFLYHSMSAASDSLVLLDDQSPADLALFGVRYLVAPDTWAAPPGLRPLAAVGRFRLFEHPGAGLFDVVDVPYAYEGSRSDFFEPSRDWLKHPLRSQNQYVAIYGTQAPANIYRAVLRRWEPLPAPLPTLSTPAGTVQNQSQRGEIYQATLTAVRSAYILFRASYHPGLRAEIDGRAVAPVMVTPGFAAFPVAAGSHRVRVYYTPGSAKTTLFWLGLVSVLALGCLSWTHRLAAAETWFTSRSAGMVQRFRPTPGTPFGRLAATWKRHRVHLALVCTVTLLAMRPLYRGLLVAGHDAAEYPPRLVEFHESVRTGDLVPIWAPDLANGYGQPLFEFVPPVAYWTAEFYYLLGAGLADSYQFGALTLAFIAALALYGLGVGFGSRGAGLLMATAYLFSPYLDVNLFVRGNFMESAATTLLPLAVLGLWLAIESGTTRAVALGALGLALLLLSHNATTLLSLPFLALVAGAFAGRDRARLVRAAAVLALGVGLAFWFLLPAFVEKQYVHIERLREGYLHYTGHFATVSQLLYSPWGYGLSLPGIGDGMSFTLGPVHLLLGAAGAWLAGRSARTPFIRRLALACAVGVLGGAWLTTELSAPLWAALPTLQYLEFPWRALAVPTLSLTLLGGVFFLQVSAKGRNRRLTLTGAVGALIVLNLFHAAPSGFLTFDDPYYAPGQIARLGLNTSTREEYEPRTVAERPPFSPTLLTPVSCTGTFTATERERRPALRSGTVQTTGPCQVRLNLFAYPHWNITVNGQSASTRTEPVAGRILVDLPAGRSEISAVLQPTPLRRGAGYASLAVLALVAWVVLRNPRFPGQPTTPAVSGKRTSRQEAAV